MNRIAIQHAYYGCKVSYNGEEREVYAISENGIDMFTETDEFEFADHEDCRLLLTPLFEITDEHCHIIANMFGLHTAGNKIKRMVDALFIENDSFQLQISHSGYICLRKNDKLYNANVIIVIDTLRGWGYNLGYGSYSPQDLIDNGIVKG